jgi:Ca2+-transporting ATPase
MHNTPNLPPKDPVRQEVPAAVAQCKKSGITVRMLTGDNIETAKAIAIDCGIFDESLGHVAILGPDFRNKSDEEVDSLLPNLRVMARSSPEDKYRLVTRLKKMGEVVAVTGDGTNDAPQLKEGKKRDT